jgi:hypothetical protein
MNLTTVASSLSTMSQNFYHVVTNGREDETDSYSKNSFGDALNICVSW